MISLLREIVFKALDAISSSVVRKRKLFKALGLNGK